MAIWRPPVSGMSQLSQEEPPFLSSDELESRIEHSVDFDPHGLGLILLASSIVDHVSLLCLAPVSFPLQLPLMVSLERSERNPSYLIGAKRCTMCGRLLTACICQVFNLWRTLMRAFRLLYLPDRRVLLLHMNRVYKPGTLQIHHTGGCIALAVIGLSLRLLLFSS